MINSYQMKIVMQLVWLLVLSLFLFACASKPQSQSEPQQLAMIDNGTGQQDSDIVLPKPKTKTYVHNAAIKRLIERAILLTEQERYESAIQELERGLSIAPNNPHIWQNMALVRLHQGRYWQAEQLASKSNALSQGDDMLMSINSQIITVSKTEQGDQQ